MIKAVIFDFDGVILESADIKTEAFRELFMFFPEHVEEILKYHLLNAGISRYVKFRHAYEHILGLELSLEKEAELGEDFSRIVFEKVLAAPFVTGAREFLDDYNEKYLFFIASGTPEKELQKIVRTRGIEKCFKEIHGSPKEKKDIINNVANRFKLSKKEIVYVGDAQSDRIAAKEAQVAFVERKSDLCLNPDGSDCIIKDLTRFDEILDKKGTE